MTNIVIIEITWTRNAFNMFKLQKLNKLTKWHDTQGLLCPVATENVIPTENVIHYIFGYYIFGYNLPTENVITENVISPIITNSIVLKGGSNRGGRKWGKYLYFVVYCNFVYFVGNILCSDSSSNSQVEKLNPMHFFDSTTAWMRECLFRERNHSLIHDTWKVQIYGF